MGDYNRNMKFGYFKASPKLKKKYFLSREMPQSYYHSSK